MTPESVVNRPGLGALAYRVGTHATFSRSMQNAIAARTALRSLTTREHDDPSMGLIDAWASVLDVLGFYQERIANEGYLRTATERMSVLELARCIGYELRPGVAAGTWLAFTLETSPAAPKSVRIDIGTKAQSVPGQDELPQTFETIEQIEARGEWNAIRARTRRLVLPSKNDREIYLKGTTTGLREGDALLIVGDERKNNDGSERWDVRLVTSVNVVAASTPEQSYTKVDLDRGLGSHVPFVAPAAVNPRVYALRQRASLFGYNAPEWRIMPESLKEGYIGSANATGSLVTDPEWPGFTISGLQDDDDDAATIYLDALYPKIFAGSWIVLSIPEYQEIYSVKSVAEDSRAAFTLVSKCTRLVVKGESLHDLYNERLRDTTVYAQSEELEIAERPVESDVSGVSIDLERIVDTLQPGRNVAVTGVEVSSGLTQSEVKTIRKVELAAGVTRLTFTSALENTYRRDSVVLNANVAHATHGETKSEVIGSGDGSIPFQRFDLKNLPLTHVSSTDPSGGTSTLELRVNGVLWNQAPSLYRQSPASQSYITRIGDDATVTVQFGDGVSGTRLPTGVENISARYRVGTGLAGMVDAGQISLLMTRALGVKGVVNPTAPAGAADPDQIEHARENAPLTVLTLDRIVSLLDYEDFTRTFGGIGKAQATLLWNGERRLVHLTVAATDGSPVATDSDLYKNLVGAIDLARHAEQHVRIDPHRATGFNVVAKLKIDPLHIPDDVITAAIEAVRSAFSFTVRSFGQPVAASDVIAVLQGVEGVVMVDLDRLYIADSTIPITPLGGTLRQRLGSSIATWTESEVRAAQLLTVNPDGILLTELLQ